MITRTRLARSGWGTAPDAPFAERMRQRTATVAGRARYKLRQQTVKPVFGVIKEAIGFRHVSLREQKKVSLEWLCALEPLR